MAVLCAVVAGCGEDPATEPVEARGTTPEILNDTEIASRQPWVGNAGGTAVLIAEHSDEGTHAQWSQRREDGTWSDAAAIPGLEPSGYAAVASAGDVVVVASVPCKPGEPALSDCWPADHMTVMVFDGSQWTEAEVPGGEVLSEVLAANGELGVRFADEGASTRLRVSNNAVRDRSANFSVVEADGTVTLEPAGPDPESRCVDDDGRVFAFEQVPSEVAKREVPGEVSVDLGARYEVTVSAPDQRSSSADPVGSVGVLGWIGVFCTDAGVGGAGDGDVAVVTAQGSVELDTPLAAPHDMAPEEIEEAGTGPAAVLWDRAGDQLVVVDGTEVRAAPVELADTETVEHATVLGDEAVVLVRDRVILEHGEGAPKANAGLEDDVGYSVMVLPLS